MPQQMPAELAKKTTIPQMKGLGSCETTELHLIKNHKG